MYCSSCPSPRTCGSNCVHTNKGAKKKVIKVSMGRGNYKKSTIPMPFKKSMPSITQFGATKVTMK